MFLGPHAIHQNLAGMLARHQTSLYSATLTPTCWVVLTGAPCSGNTTTINALQDSGYSVQDEAAREVIKFHLDRGIGLEKLFADATWFQDQVYNQLLRVENSLDVGALIYMDRSLGDVIGFCRANGVDVARYMPQFFDRTYREVFILDPLPFADDGARIADEAYRLKVDTELERAYRELGYDPLRVPVMPVAERVRFILERSVPTPTPQ